MRVERNSKAESKLTGMRALEAMNDIVQANFDKLPNPQQAHNLKTAKAQVDSVAIVKSKNLRSLRHSRPKKWQRNVKKPKNRAQRPELRQ